MFERINTSQKSQVPLHPSHGIAPLSVLLKNELTFKITLTSTGCKLQVFCRLQATGSSITSGIIFVCFNFFFFFSFFLKWEIVK